MKQLSTKLMAVASICGLILALGTETSFAAAQKKSARYAGESIEYSSSAPAGGRGGVNRVSLGMTTIPMFPGGGSILTSTSAPGLSALLDLNDGNSLQMIFTIGFSSGFNVSTGAIFRHDVKTSGDSGFHVGGGLGLGVGSSPMAGGYNFGLIGMGVGGFHVAVPGTSGNLVAHFDAALGVGFTAGTSTSFYTSLGAVSSALGLSLHYAL